MSKRIHTFSIKASGSSMYPLLHNGDIIQYNRIAFDAINRNDILLINVNNALIAHRVIYKNKTICITRGDNNFSNDIAIQQNKVLAKVVRFKRKGRWHDLQDAYYTQSTLYINEIQKFETSLQLLKIPHVFLKGLLIALHYERSIPKRIYADCDILINRNDHIKIDKILRTHGYKQWELPLFGDSKDKTEISYMKKLKGIPVVFDIHFEPVFLRTQPEGMNFLYPKNLINQLGDELIKNREYKRIKGHSYPLCSPPHQAIYLALHIFHHNYIDNGRYQLLDAIIRNGKKTGVWNDIQEIAKQYQLEGYIYLVLLFLKKYYKTPIPKSFINAIQPLGFKRIILKYLFNKINIFARDNRFKAGIERFTLIFLLSPEPLWKKSILLLHPYTIKIAVQVIMKRLSLLIQ